MPDAVAAPLSRQMRRLLRALGPNAQTVPGYRLEDAAVGNGFYRASRVRDALGGGFTSPTAEALAARGLAEVGYDARTWAVTIRLTDKGIEAASRV